MSHFWQRRIAPPLYRKLREQSKMKVFLAVMISISLDRMARCSSYSKMEIPRGHLKFGFPMAVAVSSVKLVDVEEEAQIFLTFDSGPPKTINVPPMADGASSTVAIGEKDVVAMRIRLKGLDAVDDLKFFECNTFGGGGEPHIKPWTGHRYYFMGECDTVLLASQDFDAHIRTTIKDFYSSRCAWKTISHSA